LLCETKARLAVDHLPTVFALFHDVLMGVKVFTAGAAFELPQGETGVGKRFDHLECGAVAFGAGVLHQLFDKAEIGDLFFIEFPNGPFV
jgi:hypothetical protein